MGARTVPSVRAEPAGVVTVDRGNTTIDCMDHATGRRLRIPADRSVDAPLAEFLGGSPSRTCVASSVVEGGLDVLVATLAGSAMQLRVVGKDLPCPLALDYDNPAGLGTDRWLGALAAHRLYGSSLVVDCGSATTVNLVEADGVFRGGPIGPGLRALVAGMRQMTPRLPSSRLAELPMFPPRNSQDAVDAGVLAGYCGLVERLVAAMLQVARSGPKLVVTGGNAEFLLRLGRLRYVAHDDLVHLGMRLLVEG